MSAPAVDRGEPAASAAALRELRLEVEEFNFAYAATLDDGKLAEWPDFFTEDAFYRIRSRENADAGLPVGLVYCDGRKMILDRAFAIIHTAMFEPRYFRHIIGNTRVLAIDADGIIAATANYLLFETLIDQDTKLLQAGRYVDAFERIDGRLLLRSRDCIYDSLIVQTAIVYPV
jgi:3-phenylpropionate/cinnamic acid dioxygenase small subunit